MLCAIDIGNTHVVTGIFNGDKLENKFRFNTNPQKTTDEIGLKIFGLLKGKEIDKGQINEMILCSVVPVLTPRYEEMAKAMFGIEPVVVGPGIKSGISILYENPREVGADRIANAVGGFTLYGGPLIIVDLGTAITFDAISAKGEYIGGVIAPGIDTSMASLFKKAAQLPQVSLSTPDKVIGKNTIASMQSGAVYGFSGMIDSIVRRMTKEMEGEPKVIATGGQSEWLTELSETISEVEPDLTLQGLKIIFEKNR